MKLVYKKNDEAVSPVIATILMVAITVVLAAVLYVMVIGMGGGAAEQAPVGTMTNLQATSATNATLSFGTFSPVPPPMDIKVILTPTTGTAVQLWVTSIPDAGTETMSTDNAAVTATYLDLNPAGNAVNSGDSIKVVGLTPGASYTLTIYHAPSESLCSLTGDVTFTMPTA